MIHQEEFFLTTIQKLPKSHLLAFAASCCERLLPVYQAFQKMEKWGDFEILRNYLDLVWENVNQDGKVNDRLEEMVEKCEKVIPDSADFANIYLAGAQNAVISIIHTLQFWALSDINDILRVSQACDSTVFDYLSHVNDPDTGNRLVDMKFVEWIDSAPLYKQESGKQKQDILALESRPHLDSAFLADFRSSAGEIGIAPFKRGLIK